MASRGLDIKDIRTVINYQVPKDIDTHIHRIGRTGRMGVDGVIPGVAYTLISSRSPQDRSFTVSLVKSLQDSGQENSVTPQLLALAQSDPQWRFMMMNRNENEKFKKPFGNEKGLGLGLTSRQAVTSSMLANQTSGQLETTYGDGVQKAFSKIMGSSNEQAPEAVKKRKSRFSSAPDDPSPSVSYTPPSQPTLPGFVRASNLSMTSTSSSSSSSSVKKSRWG